MPTSRRSRAVNGGAWRSVRLLLSRPDMLLLDEPTNHLDAESVAWLERYLKEYSGTVVAITHDRYFLDNVAGWILELDRGHGIPWEGNYSSWLEQKHQRLEARGEAGRRARAHARPRAGMGCAWRPARGQAKSKARLQAYDALLNESFERQAAALEIAIPPGPRLGDVVVEADHLARPTATGFSSRTCPSSSPRGGIVGVIGPTARARRRCSG